MEQHRTFSTALRVAAAVLLAPVRPGRAIPWLPSFEEGVREAGRQGRPLLLWAMNVHPLGCTWPERRTGPKRPTDDERGRDEAAAG